MYFFVIAEKGSLRVSGDNMLAFKGQSVLFECQAAGWYPQPTLQWQVNGKKVNTYILVTFYKIHSKNSPMPYLYSLFRHK